MYACISEFEKHLTFAMNATWPEVMDVEGAAVALVRLWDVYRLDIDDLVEGNILDTHTEKLSVKDVVYIANVAKRNTMIYESIVWLMKALELVNGQNSLETELGLYRIYSDLANAYYRVKLNIPTIELSTKYENGKQ